MHLTDEQWTLVQPLLPTPVRRATGRPPIDDRLALDGILWKLSTELPWYNLPAGYPSHQTCYRRYLQWKNLDLLLPILGALWYDLLDRGGLDVPAAIAKKEIRFKGRLFAKRLTVIFPPEYKDTWQQETAVLFLSLAYQKVKRRQKQSVRQIQEIWR